MSLSRALVVYLHFTQVPVNHFPMFFSCQESSYRYNTQNIWCYTLIKDEIPFFGLKKKDLHLQISIFSVLKNKFSFHYGLDIL